MLALRVSGCGAAVSGLGSSRRSVPAIRRRDDHTYQRWRPGRRGIHPGGRITPAEAAEAHSRRRVPSEATRTLSTNDGARTELRNAPEILAFARWFADWWLRRGQELTGAENGRV